MSKEKYTIEELENLSYYDFMSHLGASFYQIGGPRSTLKLVEQCQIDKDKIILEVGCGTGFNACLMAKQYGCKIVGVDIAEVSLEKAKERAEKEGLQDKAEFRKADAYKLPFEPETYDIVVTTFVSQFLDMEKALKEFTRVLKPGGYIGINEMYKDNQIPPEPAEEIQKAEDTISNLTQLPFKLQTPEHWRELFENTGLQEVEINKSQEYIGVRDSPHIIREMGGWGQLFKTMIMMVKYTIQSEKIRNRFKGLQTTKTVFLRKKSTRKHVGYVLATGKKII